MLGGVVEGVNVTQHLPPGGLEVFVVADRDLLQGF